MLLIVLRLCIKKFPGGHAHHPHRRPFGHELFCRFKGNLDFRTTGDQNNIGILTGSVNENVCSPVESLGGCVLGIAVQCRKVLTGQCQNHRAVPVYDGGPPGLGGFIGITGSDNDEVWHCSEGSQMFDRLMRRAVFTQTDTVMGKHINDFQFCQGRQTDRRPHVIGKNQKRGAVWN